MITEDYVSFETAKLLKEKGFDARCPMIYTADGKLLYADVKHHNMYAVTNKYLESYNDIIAPTLQMTMKWLREIHNITIGVLFQKNRIYYEVSKNGNIIFGIDTPLSYESACETAIKYCLESLI